jgi:polyisoprenyl-teichoic acid--peptidoglycan teichoic acid transferase
MKGFRFSRRNIVVLVAMLLVMITTVLLPIVLLVRIGRVQSSLETLGRGLGTEVERQNQLVQMLESNQRLAAGSIREFQELLNLPVTSFQFPRDSRAPTDQQDPALPFFRALERLQSHHQSQDLLDDTARILREDAAVRGVFSEYQVDVRSGRETGTWIVIDTSAEDHGPRGASGQSFDPLPLFSLRISGPSLPVRLVVEPIQGEETAIPYTGESERLAAELTSTFAAGMDDATAYVSAYRHARNLLHEAIRADGLTRVLRSRGMNIQAEETRHPYSVEFLADDGRTVFVADIALAPPAIRIDGEEAAAETVEDLAEHLATRVRAADLRPEHLRMEDKAKERILAMSENPDFSNSLNRAGLSLMETPRETLDFYAFDLLDDMGRSQGSFAVLKNSGEIYLLDQEDVMITGFQTLVRPRDELQRPPVSDRERAQTLPEDFPPSFRAGAGRDGTDILLIGSHETKADTIMLVHLSPERTVSMVSIPRDIYYQRRKLSDHYEVYGARPFIRRIEEITSRSIDGYVAIDMYAFIEVIDVLGGITMTLPEPLNDPTYRVRDDGEWGTLHYPAGTYALNGVEALRIARSRATTTDFGRSERQQAMLEAIRSRINDLHAGDLDTVYNLFRTLYDYVDTDLNAWELTQYFLAFRNARIANRAGMSYENVLYSTYSNVHARGISMEEAEEMEDFFLGLWILLPRGDDWNVIPWFVDRNLNPPDR